MRTVLVTGCNGFGGRALVKRLKRERDLRVVGCDLAQQGAKVLDGYENLDLCDTAAVQACLGRLKPDCIFNMAGLVSGPPGELYRANFLASVTLLEGIREASPGSALLLVGSAAEYGEVREEDLPIRESHPCRPAGAYGVSKYAMTLAALDHAKSFGTKVALARPFNLIGAGISPALLVGAVIKRIKEALKDPAQPLIRVGNLETQRDFIDVDDAAEAFVRIVKRGAWGEVYNVCSGKGVPIRFLVEQLLKKAERKVDVWSDPALLKKNDVKAIYGCCEKMESQLCFTPGIPLEQSLKAAWDAAVEGEAST